MKRLGIGLEIGAALLLSPLVFWGGARGALACFAALSLLAALGVRRELDGPMERLRSRTRGDS